MSKKVHCRSLSSIHIHYNHDPVQALYSLPGRCTQFAIFNCTEVVSIRAPRPPPVTSALNLLRLTSHMHGPTQRPAPIPRRDWRRHLLKSTKDNTISRYTPDVFPTTRRLLSYTPTHDKGSLDLKVSRQRSQRGPARLRWQPLSMPQLWGPCVIYLAKSWLLTAKLSAGRVAQSTGALARARRVRRGVQL